MVDLDAPKKRKYAAFNAFVVLCLSVFAGAVVLLYVWLLDKQPPIEVLEAYPAKTPFTLGEPIVIEERMVIHRRCPGTVSRGIIDSRNVTYPVLLPSDPLLSVTGDRVHIEFQMPVTLGPGRYRYRAEATWQCNPIRSLRTIIADVPFEVMAVPQPEADAGSAPEAQAGSGTAP